MALTLYGHDGSGSAAVAAVLLLAGQPFVSVRAATWAADSALDALRQANPLMQIPTLVWDDGTVMTESAAILIELGLRHPASGLLPAAPADRARALRGLVFVAANCCAMIGVIDFPERVIATGWRWLEHRPLSVEQRRQQPSLFGGRQQKTRKSVPYVVQIPNGDRWSVQQPRKRHCFSSKAAAAKNRCASGSRPWRSQTARPSAKT